MVLLREAPLAFVARLGRSTGRALLGWAVVAPLVAAGLYVLLLPLFRRRPSGAA